MPIATPHIDLLTVLSLVETRLATIVGVSIEELGSVPDEAGATAKVLRIKDLEFTYPDRRRTDEGDEASFSMSITVRVRADGEGGALARAGEGVGQRAVLHPVQGAPRGRLAVVDRDRLGLGGRRRDRRGAGPRPRDGVDAHGLARREQERDEPQVAAHQMTSTDW